MIFFGTDFNPLYLKGMFTELEQVLNRLEGRLKHVCTDLKRLEKKIDLLEGRIELITTEDDHEVDFLSRSEAAKKLGVHVDTITKYINSKDLKSIKIGRRVLIEKRALQEFIDQNRYYSYEKAV